MGTRPPTTEPHVERPGPAEFRDPLVRREMAKAAVWFGMALLIVGIVVLAQPLLLIVGGAIFAVFLDGGARLLGRILPIPRGWRLLLTILLGFGFLGWVFWFAGTTIADQFEQLRLVVTAQFNRLLHLIGSSADDRLWVDKEERYVDAFKREMPSWADIAVFGLLIDRVGEYQLEEFAGCSFEPLNQVLPAILREEKGHVSFGLYKCRDLIDQGRKDDVQAAIEAPRVNSLHPQSSFGDHRAQPGVLEVERTLPPAVIEDLRARGHIVRLRGPYGISTGIVAAGVDPVTRKLRGGADPRRERALIAY